MKPSPLSIVILVVFLLLASALLAQSPDSANQSAASPVPAPPMAEVPRLIKFGGTLLDAQDHPMTGPVGVTFALYSQQTGGAALWIETQNVTPDAHGIYTALLGANSANGVPAELFSSGEARWLELQVEQQAEQPRVLLVSVPYALKAKDAETLGGKPASAFVTTETLASAGNSAGAAAAAPSPSTTSTVLANSKAQTTPKRAASTPPPATACTSVTSDGTGIANSVAKFTAACNIQNSAITETGGNVGIGTAVPAVALDVVGNNAGLRLSGTGTHQVTVTGATSGRLGQDSSGFFFASDTNGKTVRFLTNNGTLNEWMRITSAGNVGIGTATPAAKLDVVGNFNLPNTTSGGTAGVIQLGGTPFAHSFGSQNTFVGASAGNTSAGLTGSENTGVGASTLFSNTTGSNNSALGFNALNANTTGFNNSAFGVFALKANTMGFRNSAFGFFTLSANTTGTQNSAFGEFALSANTTASSNSAFGIAALESNTTGSSNSAFGASALENSTGDNNAAFGTSALLQNTSGNANSAFGAFALVSNMTGFNDSAFGFNALSSNTAPGNSAFGFNALSANTTAVSNSAFGVNALATNTTGGSNAAFGGAALFANTVGTANSAFGVSALQALGSGDSNIAIGTGAGDVLTTGSSNIYIGNVGSNIESNTIRIGNPAVQTRTFIAGISGATVFSGDGLEVFVGSFGQLGTMASSRRFKDDIVDMAGESDLLMKLRPVSFYYKPELDSTHTRQYGLVAEEVAKVSPELVVFDKDGVPQTVRYHSVNAMLLNEVQKQQNTIARQQAEIQDLTARLAKLEARLAKEP